MVRRWTGETAARDQRASTGARESCFTLMATTISHAYHGEDRDADPCARMFYGRPDGESESVRDPHHECGGGYCDSAIDEATNIVFQAQVVAVWRIGEQDIERVDADQASAQAGRNSRHDRKQPRHAGCHDADPNRQHFRAEAQRRYAQQRQAGAVLRQSRDGCFAGFAPHTMPARAQASQPRRMTKPISLTPQ